LAGVERHGGCVVGDDMQEHRTTPVRDTRIHTHTRWDDLCLNQCIRPLNACIQDTCEGGARTHLDIHRR
jgi:hypothetical protein